MIISTFLLSLTTLLHVFDDVAMNITLILCVLFFDNKLNAPDFKLTWSYSRSFRASWPVWPVAPRPTSCGRLQWLRAWRWSGMTRAPLSPPPPNASVWTQNKITFYFKSVFLVQNFTKEKAIKELTPYLASSTMDFVRTLWRNVENAGTSIGGGKQVWQAAQIKVMFSFLFKTWVKIRVIMPLSDLRLERHSRITLEKASIRQANGVERRVREQHQAAQSNRAGHGQSQING